MADYTLFTETPALAPNADSAVTVGTEFWVNAGQTAWITGIRYLAPTSGDMSPHTGAIYSQADGSRVAGPLVLPAGTAGAWVQGDFETPVELAPGRYRVGVLFPNGDYPYSTSYFGGSYTDRTIGPVTLPSSFSVDSLQQGSYTYGSTVSYPTSGASGGGNFWAGVAFTDTDPAAGPSESASLPLDGEGTLGFTLTPSAELVAMLGSEGSLATGQTPALQLVATLGGTGSLGFDAEAQIPQEPGSASFDSAGLGELRLDIVPATSSDVALGGSGALSWGAQPAFLATLSTNGSGQLEWSVGRGTIHASIDLGSRGQLTASGIPGTVVRIDLSAAGSLTAAGEPSAPQLTASVSLSGSGSLRIVQGTGVERDITIRAWLPASTRRAWLTPQTWKAD